MILELLGMYIVQVLTKASQTFRMSTCSDMYLAAGELLKAVEIMGQNGWVERCVLQQPFSSLTVYCTL